MFRDHPSAGHEQKTVYKYFDFGLDNSNNEAAVLLFDQEAGVQDENMQRAHYAAHTWFVCANVRLVPAKSSKRLKDSPVKMNALALLLSLHLHPLT